MGQKADQNSFPSTYRSDSQGHGPPPPVLPAGPPPLPPRNPSSSSPPATDAPPAYSEVAPTYHSQPITESWSAQDPRSTSTQSLVPRDQPEGDDKRRLLLIWIHGFMGNETSFQSFPAHVHNVLAQRLQDRVNSPYVVHTKVYPRYKSRNKIEVARDAFSAWLAPHEDANTDIILLGHSLGGILSAEVVLKPASAGEHKQYRHRILGTINFDTPFLGMHPGVISSGLGSLFRPTSTPPSPSTAPIGSQAGNAQPEPLALPAGSDSSYSRPTMNAESSQTSNMTTNTLSATTSTSTLPLSSFDLPIDDPNYDPPYVNDVHNPQRSGRSNIWHFLNKHADGATLVSKAQALSRAAKSLVTSHLEFGGCLADYYGLRVRYKQLKDLDGEKGEKRVRFLNYYTASTGRPKRVKTPGDNGGVVATGQLDGQEASVEQDLRDMRLQPSEEDAVPLSPRDSVEPAAYDRQDSVAQDPLLDDEEARSAASSMARISPAAMEDSDEEPDGLTDAPEPAGDVHDHDHDHDNDNAILDSTQSDHTLALGGELPPQPSQPAVSFPPLPDLPNVPPLFDPTLFTDKDTRKLAEKEHSRTIKNYERLLKDRERTIKERRKLIEKRETAIKKDREKALAAREKEKADARKKADKQKTKTAKTNQSTTEEERLQKEKERLEIEARRLDGATQESLSQATTSASLSTTQTDGPPDTDNKPPKDRKFCLLPPAGANGKPDPCWIRVFMPGVDEVGAHCGLFTVDGGRYEWFVGDVAERVEGWVG